MSTGDGRRLKAYIIQNKGVSPRQAHAREMFRDGSLGKQKRKEKEEGESVIRMGADRSGGYKDIRGEDWSCSNREYVYGN